MAFLFVIKKEWVFIADFNKKIENPSFKLKKGHGKIIIASFFMDMINVYKIIKEDIFFSF